MPGHVAARVVVQHVRDGHQRDAAAALRACRAQRWAVAGRPAMAAGLPRRRTRRRAGSSTHARLGAARAGAQARRRTAVGASAGGGRGHTQAAQVERAGPHGGARPAHGVRARRPGPAALRRQGPRMQFPAAANEWRGEWRSAQVLPAAVMQMRPQKQAMEGLHGHAPLSLLRGGNLRTLAWRKQGSDTRWTSLRAERPQTAYDSGRGGRRVQAGRPRPVPPTRPRTNPAAGAAQHHPVPRARLGSPR